MKSMSWEIERLKRCSVLVSSTELNKKALAAASASTTMMCLRRTWSSITFPLHERFTSIGVFDSGIGGLTVAKALRELLPSEDIFYLGDTARVPYGNKSAETVERYSLELAGMLMRENAKTIVVACNTVSSVAIPKLRTSVSVPVIGVIEPGAQAAIAITRNRHIGVIGTRATIRSGAYENALRALNVHVRVSSRACPLLVPLIEEGLLNDELTDQRYRAISTP